MTMTNATGLTGAALPTPIAPGGYSLQAPDLVATVRELTPAESASRTDGGVHEEALLKALANADVYPVKWFEMEVQADNRPPGESGAARAGGATAVTRDNEPAMVLRVPALGEKVGYVVLYTDEAGVSRWFFPEQVAAQIVAPAGAGTRGGAGDVVFHLPRASAPRPAGVEGSASRGPLAKLGRRLFRVLAWATEDLVGEVALAVATRWEKSRRGYAFRPAPLADADVPVSWEALRGGRALLWLHGTFSTTRSAFAELPPTTWGELATLYGGRLFAFDHPTLHHSPQDNAQTFLSMLPEGADLDLDIVTHSRGGLVGRELTERLADFRAGGRRVRVRKAVLVAAPNLGTLLTDSRHGVTLLDRYTFLFAELPDDAFTLSMEGLFMLAKLLVHGALHGLPGLRSMYPGGDYLRRINTGARGETRYYAVAADFRPSAPGVLGRWGTWAGGKFLQDLFGESNDGVVPTGGSYECAGAAGFPIPPERRLVFATDVGVHHCNYFAQPKLFEQLLRWLKE